MTAFVHKSYASDFVPALSHNERLEFLGDSILGGSISSLLYQFNPEWSESQMTLYKIALVREETLAQAARDIQLGDFLFISKGEEKQGGKDKDSILSDSLESLIGAFYLIYGFDTARQFIEGTVWKFLPQLMETNCKSYKSLMQERAQGHKLPIPNYTTNEVNNPNNKHHTTESIFESIVMINGETYGKGYGKNKKKAQEEAAKNAYQNRHQFIQPH